MCFKLDYSFFLSWTDSVIDPNVSSFKLLLTFDKWLKIPYKLILMLANHVIQGHACPFIHKNDKNMFYWNRWYNQMNDTHTCYSMFAQLKV